MHVAARDQSSQQKETQSKTASEMRGCKSKDERATWLKEKAEKGSCCMKKHLLVWFQDPSGSGTASQDILQYFPFNRMVKGKLRFHCSKAYSTFIIVAPALSDHGCEIRLWTDLRASPSDGLTFCDRLEPTKSHPEKVLELPNTVGSIYDLRGHRQTV